MLFVCQDEERAQRLAMRAQRFLNKKNPDSWKLFLFASLHQLLAETQGPICVVAYDPNRYPLAPNMAKSLFQNLKIEADH